METIRQKQSVKLILGFIISLLSLSVSAQWLKADLGRVVDENDNEVILRGMGLGGWMLQEPYMMEMADFATTQWQIKAKIESLIGTINTEAFYDAWLANHCTRRDIDSLASWGFNSVRLPMHYNLYTLPIEDEPVAGVNTWLDKGFALTDSLINWCKANHMYVILDLHAAPGGQGKDAAISDADPSKPSLWESDLNKQKTIALWRKLAERYANEPWVGGYDLINEPNWGFTAGGNQNGCSENSNIPLRQLYVDITNAIRQVDTKHLIIIEGNCWGNNYNGILPPWDNNMALSFHKYWSNNDQGSISGIVSLRYTYNMPIWLGESGENSNPWFREAIELVENNFVGWAWWPMKKIGSVVGPLTITKTTDYQALLNYWKNGGSVPSVSFATNTLMQIAENAKIQNCTYHKDVIDAMFRQVHDSTTRPFANNVVPGVVHASDFDMGRAGKAYYDTDIANYHGSTGTYTAWNMGWVYRNDGVDVGDAYDPDPASNGFYVGWTADNEWTQYTVDVDSTAAYTVKVRYANLDADSKIRLLVNGADMIGELSLPPTGGYFSWNTMDVNNVILNKGRQKIRIFFEKGGANISFLKFIIDKKPEDVLFEAISAETYKQTEDIYMSLNKMLVVATVNAGGFACTVNGKAVSISEFKINKDNSSQVIVSLSQHFSDIDEIMLNYSGGTLKATDGTMLQNFSNLKVKNNLPVLATIPGKIEAEAFTVNNGLVLENTSDVGGGKNIGYTSVGDFLEYKVRVLKTDQYNLDVRVACLASAGRIDVQQLNSTGAVVNSAQLNIPVTGGWQTWQTVSTKITLTEGIWTLRVKIVQPEFNMNWYIFTESGVGISEDAGSVFFIYPNPAKDGVTITIPGTAEVKKTLQVRSVSGILMKKFEIADNVTLKYISVSDLPRGLYIIEMEMAGKVYRNKLIVH